MKKVLVAMTLCFGLLVMAGCNKTTTNTGTTPNADRGTKTQVANTTGGAGSENTGAQVDGTENEANTDGTNTAVNADPAVVTLAQCIADKGLKMYGTEWCGHCKNQKKLFGDAFTYVDYTDCDNDKETCNEAGVRGYPTWVGADGQAYPGTQSLEKLASIAGCEG